MGLKRLFDRVRRPAADATNDTTASSTGRPLAGAGAPTPAPAAPAAPRFDTTLTSAAQRWLEALPPRVRPTRLGETYPRVANRLALVWNDPNLCDRVFDSLLVDRRGGRRGFPAEVTAELLRLHEFHEDRARRGARDTPHDTSWSGHLQAIADR